jgi:hypothetical protein
MGDVMKNRSKSNEGSGKRSGWICCLIFLLIITFQASPVFPADQMGTMPMDAAPGSPATQSPGSGTNQQSVQGTGWGWGTQQPGMNPMMGGGGMGGMMGSGMGGGCMGGMGNAMGSGNMGGMMGNTMGGTAGGMGMNMDQPMTMREILYILSMQDALQIIKDVLSIQGKILESDRGQDKKALLRDLKSAQDRLTKLSGDYRGMIAGKNMQ